MITLDQAGRDLGRTVVLSPPADLAGVVEYYWYEAEPLVSNVSCRVVPDPSSHLIFKTGSGPGGGSLRVVGPRSTFVDIDKTGRQLTVGVRLRPGSVPGLLGCSPADLLDRSAALQEIVGHSGVVLTERVQEAVDVSVVIAQISAYLRARMVAGRVRDWRVDAAQHLLVSSAHKRVGMAQLVEATGNSERTLRNILRSEIGLAFKRWAQIHRLSTLLHEALALAEPHWASLAVAGGYCDQPHLIREHRQLLGETPAQFLRRGRGAGSSPAESSNLLAAQTG